MKLKRPAALVCAGAVLALGGASGAAAWASPSDGPAHVRQAAAEHHVTYSDADIVGLLVFAKGKAADDHPELADAIKSHKSNNENNEKVTLEQIDQFTTALKALDADFHDKITVAVQIDDPFQAKAGMERLNQDIDKFLSKAKDASADTVSPQGIVWHDANIVIELNVAGAINAIGYANVAGATEAVVALVVVPSAVSYGFDMRQPNGLDEDTMVAAVAHTL
ncbi:sporulation delaying protein family toxin [Streptomyces sp. SID11385]|uniref:sporulation delaying protein family toxin n=1 Tax=Streptomyces sp. SID11385 TaxID=2706031 RepID=UPI0013C65920|nr:sporulation delaying protein family toxin [Streptomyces sp. SID11385]NEA42013.1 sporulation delaying protein family toxin [Streptomyces sp. SID11385]